MARKKPTLSFYWNIWKPNSIVIIGISKVQKKFHNKILTVWPFPWHLWHLWHFSLLFVPLKGYFDNKRFHLLICNGAWGYWTGGLLTGLVVIVPPRKNDANVEMSQGAVKMMLTSRGNIETFHWFHFLESEEGGFVNLERTKGGGELSIGK